MTGAVILAPIVRGIECGIGVAGHLDLHSGPTGQHQPHILRDIHVALDHQHA